MFDIEFWKNFLSNALATFIGAIVGIPVALWINRIQHRSVERAERNKLALETKTRKRRILELLESEISANKEVLEFIREGFDSLEKLEHRKGEEQDEQYDYDELKNRRRNLYFLRTEIWNSFSDGGELQWIQDPDLLRAIALVYEFLRMARYAGEEFESFMKEFEKEIEIVIIESKAYPYRLMNEQGRLYNVLKGNIQAAIERIDEALLLMANERMAE